LGRVLVEMVKLSGGCGLGLPRLWVFVAWENAIGVAMFATICACSGVSGGRGCPFWPMPGLMRNVTCTVSPGGTATVALPTEGFPTEGFPRVLGSVTMGGLGMFERMTLVGCCCRVQP